MPVLSPLPPGELQFCDINGHPYAGGLVYLYTPGTLTTKLTYVDQAGLAVNSQPITLNASGRCRIWGNGDYRIILKDSLGSQIYDAETASALPSDVISEVMLPVVGAATLAEARRLLGVDQAIQDAVNAVELLPGPAGSTGGKGDKGDKGDTGATGGAGGSSVQTYGGNPGYWLDVTNKFLISFGHAAIDGTGTGTVTFAKPYANILSVVATPYANYLNVTARIMYFNNSAMQVGIEDTNNSTIGYAGFQFTWAAYGFVA